MAFAALSALELGAIRSAALSLARELRAGTHHLTSRSSAYTALDEVMARAVRLGAPRLTRDDVLREHPAQAHGLCAATALGHVPSIAARLDDLAAVTTTTEAPPPRAA